MLHPSHNLLSKIRKPLQLVIHSAVVLVLVGNFWVTASCSKRGDNEQSSIAAQTSGPKWEGHLIRRPGNTPEDAKVYLVKDGKKHWVVSGDWLKQNGYKFPEDVQIISAGELAQLPEGEPYQ